ncbi:MAG TPA: helix-turn-helix domain-containing protein [Alphaproteobacteria bacterium]|nr:helix-turn-helix domain-containing protein [Alphaproteobacteria bacterium]
MKLAIFGDNPVQTRTLSTAFFPVFQDVQTYTYKEDGFGEPDLCLCLCTKATADRALTISKQHESFAVLMEDFSDSTDLADESLSVFSAPLRLGKLVQAAQDFIRLRKQREQLKPIHFADFVFDPAANQLKKKNKKNPPLKLTEKEQDILFFLYEKKGQPVSRQNLLDHVWGYVEGVETHTLETHIYRLRQKIEDNPASPELLLTNDEGYFLNF